MNQKADSPGYGADSGAFAPGFDFLRKLAQGADPQTLYASWIAPTLDPKVLDQRIGELKAVQFWLEQNSAALKATLQALEVQKMTLAALRSMGGVMPGAQTAYGASSGASGAGGTNTNGAGSASSAAGAGPDPAVPPLMADAMQYWGALTQQFQAIANQALQEMAARGAAATATGAATSSTEAEPAASAAAASSASASSASAAQSGQSGHTSQSSAQPASDSSSQASPQSPQSAPKAPRSRKASGPAAAEAQTGAGSSTGAQRRPQV
jgi:hypothetical protein